MQVELVAHNPLRTISGIGRYVQELYAHLKPHIDVRLCTPIDPPLAERFVSLRGFPLGVRDHQPGSIVHFAQITGDAQMLWHPVRPAVATVHDLGVLVCPEDKVLFNPYEHWQLDLHMAGLRCMDYYAVNSDYTRQGLVERLGISPEKIYFVQLGVDSEHFKPLPDARARLVEHYGIKRLPETWDVLYVGSELPRKNVSALLEAIARLKAKGYRLRLIKVGGPGGRRWRAQFLAAVAHWRLEQDVVIMDVVPESDLPLFYNAADLCVTPTLLEGGFAWLAMEAMACERPVVASRMAMIPPEAEAAVKIVPPRDVEALIAAMETCLADEGLRRRMGHAGRRIVAPYTWEATAQAMIRVYQAALALG